MSKEKLTNQLKNAYKQLEQESKNKGRPNTIEDNNVDYDNCNVYAMRQKIKDLEAKLAESEEKYENLWKWSFQELQKAQQQLAEKDKTIDEINKEFVQAIKDWKSLVEQKDKEIGRLEQQLKEKDTDLSLASNEIDTLKHNLNISQEHDNVMCEQYFEKCKETNQDKISFAVEQLTEIREYVKECWGLDELEGKVRLDIAKKIRLKIERLKEGK